jgi:hypothetical protein
MVLLQAHRRARCQRVRDLVRFVHVTNGKQRLALYQASYIGARNVRLCSQVLFLLTHSNRTEKFEGGERTKYVNYDIFYTYRRIGMGCK